MSGHPFFVATLFLPQLLSEPSAPHPLVLAYLALMRAFRSLLLPLKAVILNVISILATYGLMVLVFQHGWGLSLLGMDHTKLTFRFNGRDFRLTDVAGEVVKAIIA